MFLSLFHSAEKSSGNEEKVFMQVEFSMIENIHPYAWAIGPTCVYIHVQIHRLGKIAVNHFNRTYRVTDGV